MPHHYVDSAASILSILSCSSDRFFEIYDGGYSTGNLVKDAKEIIGQNQGCLGAAGGDRYRLDELLLGMLDHAPDPSGQRYVAVVLLIANGKGTEAVVEAAKAWLDYLFFPIVDDSVLALSKAKKTEPGTSQTPTYEDTLVQIEEATRSEQTRFRAAQIAIREQHRCAVVQSFDVARVKCLISHRRRDEIPSSPQTRMKAAYIIPFSLNKFHETKDLKTAAYTWDMLHSWTGIDIHDLVGSKINSPENGIYMNETDHFKFGSFLFYFDKDEYPNSPNKYKVQMALPGPGYRLANGNLTADVEFLASAQIPAPNPQFLKVHAAFAKLLARSEATEYMERVEMSNESGAPTDPNMEKDFATLLTSRLLA